jgi:anti-anti-sigma factor
LATSISVARTNHSLTISVKGKFNFEVHQQFRKAYHNEDEKPQNRVTHYKINLSDTDYFDSAALGMLLLLREEALANDATIEISNPRPEILNILKTANFHKIFEIV